IWDVLTLRTEQLEAIRNSRRTESAQRLTALLSGDFPSDAARLGEAGMHAVVRWGMDRSRSHGHSSDRETYLYLTMMFMLGSAFDEDPQLPWAKQLLASGIPTQVLHARALEYLDGVVGEDNGHLVRALVRARSIALEVLPLPDAPEFESRTVALLEEIHPSKFAAQGAGATEATIRR